MNDFAAIIPEAVHRPPLPAQTINYAELITRVYETSEGLREDMETDWDAPKVERTRIEALGRKKLDLAIEQLVPVHNDGRYPAFEKLVHQHGGAEFCSTGILREPLIQFIESEVFAHSVSARDPRKHGDEPGWYHLLGSRECFSRCSEDLLSNELRVLGGIVMPGHDSIEDFEVTFQELRNVFRSSTDVFCSSIPQNIWLMTTPEPEELIFRLPHITNKFAPHIAHELPNLKIGSQEVEELMETFEKQDPLGYAVLKLNLKDTFKPTRMLRSLGPVGAIGKMSDGVLVLDEWNRNIVKGDIRLDPDMPFGTKGIKISGQPTPVAWDLIEVNVANRIDYHNVGLRRLAVLQSFRRRSPNDFIRVGRNLTKEIIAPATALIGHLNRALPSNDNRYDEKRARVAAITAKVDQLRLKAA